MDEKCENLSLESMCMRFGVQTNQIICSICKNDKEKTIEDIFVIRSDLRMALGRAIITETRLQPVPVDADVADVLIKTCSECEHSTTQEISGVEITEWSRAAGWVISKVGNWLRNKNRIGLSCKLCGCSCGGKAKYGRIVEKLTMGKISGGCPDKDENGKSRWDRAMEDHLIK